MPLIRKETAGTANPGLAHPGHLLREGTTDERWSAARALGSDPANGTKPLAEALSTEPDTRVREAIFTSLVRIGTQECVDAVIPFLRVNDPQLRTGALDALRAMPAVRPVLPELLADADADIRVLACDLARDLPSPDATGLLCDVLARETEANVCAAAVDVLADIGTAEAIPFLRNCAARFGDVGFLTFAVSVALDQIAAGRPLDRSAASPVPTGSATDSRAPDRPAKNE